MHKSDDSKKSRIHRGFYRNGEAHRAGADVSFADIVKIFGFRAVNIGRWVTPQEQQLAANLFFDALCDLSDILRIPNEVISLKGTLALSFGVGGSKHTKAHYNSTTRELALAKNAGGGSLAHEWFHAFDHYIADKMFAGSGKHMFASETWLNESFEPIPHPLNTHLSNMFTTIFLDHNLQPSPLVKASTLIDSQQKIFYFARPQELCARAFETVMQSHSIKNTFLVSIVM